MSEEEQFEELLKNLKPCPFCGEWLVTDNDHHGFWLAHREPSNCFLRFYQILDKKDAEAWNVRNSRERRN